MAISFFCSKIISSFKNDNLTFPKKGECILVNENGQNAHLILKAEKDLAFFDQTNSELERHTHEVLNPLILN